MSDSAAVRIRRRKLGTIIVLIVAGVLMIDINVSPNQLVGGIAIGLGLAVARFGHAVPREVWLQPRLTGALWWLAGRDRLPSGTWSAVVLAGSVLFVATLGVRTFVDRGIDRDVVVDFAKGMFALAITLIAFQLVFPWIGPVIGWSMRLLRLGLGKPAIGRTLDPGSAAGLVEKGRASLAQGDGPAAFTSFCAAVAAEPDSAAAWRGLTRIDLARRAGSSSSSAMAVVETDSFVDLTEPAASTVLDRVFPRDVVWPVAAGDGSVIALADGTPLGRVAADQLGGRDGPLLVAGRHGDTLRLIIPRPDADLDPVVPPLWRRALATG